MLSETDPCSADVFMGVPVTPSDQHQQCQPGEPRHPLNQALFCTWRLGSHNSLSCGSFPEIFSLECSWHGQEGWTRWASVGLASYQGHCIHFAFLVHGVEIMLLSLQRQKDSLIISVIRYPAETNVMKNKTQNANLVWVLSITQGI